jgi:hypothetical protein
MTYILLGRRTNIAQHDGVTINTGFNDGNWTNWFKTQDLGINVQQAEIYKAVVLNVPLGGQAVIQIGTTPVSYVNPFNGSEYDPFQPPLILRGQELYFLWDVAAGPGIAKPAVTVWLRYDPAVPGNQARG